MKDAKLLVRVPCVNRSFYLYQAERGGDYRIKFTPPRWLRARCPNVPERVDRTTGTREPAAAKRIAAGVLLEFFSQDKETGLTSAEAAPVSDARPTETATLIDVVVEYLAGARKLEDKEEIGSKTLWNNVAELAKLAAVSEAVPLVTELPSRVRALGKAARKRLAKRMPGLGRSCAVLTEDLVQEFKRRQLAELADDPVAMESRRRSINSTITQARAIFGRDYMPLYAAKLRLPALTGFMAAKRCKVDKQATRYVPIPQPVIDAMCAEIDAQRSARPDLYLAFYLMLWCGMRAKEVREARLEWIVESESGAVIGIIRRPYFRPKGVPGWIAIAPSLWRDIQDLSGAKAPLDHLVPAATPTARADVLRYDLSRLVRRHIGEERTKTCHELRKHAVSMVLMRTGSADRTLAFSRHADERTLRLHYGSLLEQLPPITSSDWRVAA